MRLTGRMMALENSRDKMMATPSAIASKNAVEYSRLWITCSGFMIRINFALLYDSTAIKMIGNRLAREKMIIIRTDSFNRKVHGDFGIPPWGKKYGHTRRQTISTEKKMMAHTTMPLMITPMKVWRPSKTAPRTVAASVKRKAVSNDMVTAASSQLKRLTNALTSGMSRILRCARRFRAGSISPSSAFRRINRHRSFCQLLVMMPAMITSPINMTARTINVSAICSSASPSSKNVK